MAKTKFTKPTNNIVDNFISTSDPTKLKDEIENNVDKTTLNAAVDPNYFNDTKLDNDTYINENANNTKHTYITNNNEQSNVTKDDNITNIIKDINDTTVTKDINTANVTKHINTANVTKVTNKSKHYDVRGKREERYGLLMDKQLKDDLKDLSLANGYRSVNDFIITILLEYVEDPKSSQKLKAFKKLKNS